MSKAMVRKNASSYFTGTTYNAATASYSDVNAAMAFCVAGDILQVPSGSATWNSQLLITVGIKIVKLGTGTIINGYGGGYQSFLFYYQPSNPGANEPFRITGFTIDCNSAGSWLCFNNTSSSALTKIRIDHNTTQNVGNLRSIKFELGCGPVFGVIDHNTIPGSLVNYGNNETTWGNLSFAFGTANNMYYEDNILTFNSNDSVAGGAGGRYCFRHNTISTSGAYPVFDAHGNQGGGSNLSTMGIEVYENDVSQSVSDGLVHQRGGMALVYNNRVTGGTLFYMKLQEEFLDSDNPPASGPTGQPQHVSSSYYWNNLQGSTLVNPAIGAVAGPGLSADYCYYASLGRNVPLLNSDAWVQAASFDGSSGVGYGLLSARPSGSAVGVGYWATDTSTLYRWNGSSWDTYYTPYTYPHPLIAVM